MPLKQAESEAKADPQHQRLEKRVLRVCDSAGAFIEWWGFRAIHGRVWTLLALKGTPMTQSTVANTLGVSRALVSNAVSELSEFGLVRPVEDHRNSPYEATIDVWPTISDILRTREWMLMESARVALESAIEEAETQVESGHDLTFDLDRMKMLLTMTETAQAFLRTIVGMRIPKPLEGLAGWAGKAAALVRSFRPVA
uniref:HTH marR-type domain-containing protein n=1 Tax=uncultured myxobacterium HF0200_05J13 TaxID=723557 RepID=E7C3M0_9BACT|nr:hypothetical protein [uncultured myxobacterium HF0200_05J13]